MTDTPRARVLLVAALIVSLMPVAGRSEEPPELVTDRPDQTESAEVVPPGTFQIETGWTLTGARQEDPGSGLTVDREAQELAGTLLRIGLGRRFELRLGWDGLVWEGAATPGQSSHDRHGKGDAALGAKVVLLRQRGAAPQLALLAGTSLPAGDDELSTDRADPDFRLSFAHTLSERLSLGYNLGMEWETEEDPSGERHTLSSAIYTLALGIAVSERLGTFVEVAGAVAASTGGEPHSSFDGGVTYLVRGNLQLDAFAGVGLSDAAPDWFVGLGLSVRLPR